jgi:hypothetical protein
MNITVNITLLDALSAQQETQKCIVPKLDPFDESILEFVTGANLPKCGSLLHQVIW